MNVTLQAIKRTAMRIREWRDRRGLTQAELARRAGVSRVHLARIESGRHDPRLSMLVVLARALRIKVRKLIE